MGLVYTGNNNFFPNQSRISSQSGSTESSLRVRSSLLLY
uniref:Uncharacterized protein n=1 Tax=Anguilla anguilla TaxID=7936 RepID=A0A0E9UQU4_ANGAN